jgi:type IV secretion system protein VirD4
MSGYGKYAALTGGVLFALSAVWSIIAAALWSALTANKFALLGWYDALDFWGYDHWNNICIVLSGGAPALFLGSLVWTSLRNRGTRRRLLPRGTRGPRPIERGVTDNHGHSEWRSSADTRALFSGPDPFHGGIAVGEDYRVDLDSRIAGVAFDPELAETWGQGGRAPLLIDPATHGSGHSLVFAGSGHGKTANAACSAITWTGSSVILDPSVELGPMLDMALRRQRKNVVHIGIPDPSKPVRMTGFNVLSFIDTNRPAQAEVDVLAVISRIYRENDAGTVTRPEDPFFGKMGRYLAQCLLAHLVWSNPDDTEISLRVFAEGFAIPESQMRTRLEGIYASSPSPMARRIAATLMESAAPETWGGVYLNAINGISWLFTCAYADLVSVGSFDPQSLLVGRTTAFLSVDQRTLETTPEIARVLIGSLLDTVFMADGHIRGKCLFLLDEAAQLGPLAPLAVARDAGRKYGITLHLLFQSIGQLREAWLDSGAKAWIDAASWIGYASVRSGSVGKELSDQLGSHGVLAYSEGDNRGRSRSFGINRGSTSRGSNTNVHEIRRALISAAELQQDLRDDELIVVPASGKPIRCSRALWFRRPEMKAQIEESRFVRA